MDIIIRQIIDIQMVVITDHQDTILIIIMDITIIEILINIIDIITIVILEIITITDNLLFIGLM